ncbi:MAG TPA: chaperone modulator CbpM [Thermoanaerobaculia bacterium]|jgi:chaperone modulatory protein CbpM
MKLARYEIVLCRDSGLLTLDALAARAGLHPALVELFVECGLILAAGREDGAPRFDAAMVPRLQRIVRLRRDLGVNLAGVAVILDLRDRLSAFQRQVEVQRSEFKVQS